MRSSREVITEIFCHYRVAPRRKHKELTNHNDDNADSECVAPHHSRDASPKTKSAPAIARNHSRWRVRLNSPLASFECESNAENLARLRLALLQSQPRLSSVTSTRGFAHAHAHIQSTKNSFALALSRVTMAETSASDAADASKRAASATAAEDTNAGVSAAFALTLSVFSSVSLVIVNKHLISILGFREGTHLALTRARQIVGILDVSWTGFSRRVSTTRETYAYTDAKRT